MLETGWTGPELEAARPRHVLGLRWSLYARSLEPLVTRDYDRMILDVDRVDRPAKPATLRAERRRLIEELRGEKRTQAEVRELLEIDVDDDAEEPTDGE